MDHNEINTCQNCGHVLKNLYDFGRYQDGSVNTEFCYHCFRDGKLLKEIPTRSHIELQDREVIDNIGKATARSKKLAGEILPKPRRKRGKSTV